MEIVVNDTNIFIDLIKADLIEAFMSLPFEVHTTDFIIDEFTNPEQEPILENLKNNGKLTIKSYDFEEIEKIGQLNSIHSKLSYPDCSVLHYAKAIIYY